MFKYVTSRSRTVISLLTFFSKNTSHSRFYCAPVPSVGKREPFQLTSRLIKSEIKAFDDYKNTIEHRIQSCQSAIYDDFVQISAVGDSEAHESIHEVSGQYEYFFRREENENHENLYRRILPLSSPLVNGGSGVGDDACKILNVDRLAKHYNIPVSIVQLKMSEDHNFISFLMEVVNDASNSNNRQTKLFVKSIEQDVLCELTLPPGVTPVDIELSSIVYPESGCEGHLQLFYSASLDGIRPSQVQWCPLDPLLLFGRKALKAPPDRSQGRSKRHSRQPFSLRCSAIRPTDLTLLVDEPDPAFFLDLARSKDDQFMLVHHHSKVSSEVSCLAVRDFMNNKVPVKGLTQTLIPRVHGLQCFVNHAHGCFYVATASSIRDGSAIAEELSIRRVVSELPYASTLDWGEWEVVWPLAKDMSGTLHCGNDRYILDDYDIFERFILVYARDKACGGDISIQLLKVVKKSFMDGCGSPGIRFVKSWSGADFQSWLESSYVISESEKCASSESFVWTVTPSANGNFTSTIAHFSLSTTLIPGRCAPFFKRRHVTCFVYVK